MASSLWVRAAGERRKSISSLEGDHADVKRRAIALLKMAGCLDVNVEHILLVDRKQLESGTSKPSEFKLRCWYDPSSGIYHVSDAILHIGEEHDGGDNASDGHGSAPAAESTKLQVNVIGTDEDKAAVPCATGADVNGAETDGLSTAADPPDNDGNIDGEAITVGGNSDDGAKESGKDTVVVSTTEGKVSGGVEVPDAKETPTTTSDTATDKGEHKTTSTPAASTEIAIDLTNRSSDGTKHETEKNRSKVLTEKAAHLLAFYIAKEHRDGTMLERFVTSCSMASFVNSTE
jgi:hypothetical protein